MALALFAGAGMALFGWINTNLAAAVRLRDAEATTRMAGRISEWVQTIDPAQPEGDGELEEGVPVKWRSQALTPWTGGAPFPGGESTPFQIAMFEVQVSVTPKQGQGETEFVFRRVGVKRLQAAPADVQGP